jgi:phosphoribosylglycinamide formyltransferase-1
MSKKGYGRQVRIAVFVSGGGTNLQALIDAERAGLIKSGKITLVISNNPNAYALTRASAAGIETRVITRKEHPLQEDFERALSRAIKENGAELIVLAGFMSILSQKFVAEYPFRIINVHPSLIPSFCGRGFYGLKVHEAALERGVKITGATVHFVNEIPDGGDIIFQKAVAVRRGDTPESLQRRVMERAEWKLLPRAVEQVSKNILSSCRGNDNERNGGKNENI